MRKVLSLIAGLALIASPSGLTASAEEPVPADIDKQAYANLVKYNLCDYNLDGVIEESELERETSITLELDGVKDGYIICKGYGACRMLSEKYGSDNEGTAHGSRGAS